MRREQADDIKYLYMRDLIGLKLVAMRGDKHRERRPKKPELVEPVYLLFSDKKTIVTLEEQDYYSYHDCSTSARLIEIIQSSVLWKLYHDEFPESLGDI